MNIIGLLIVAGVLFFNLKAYGNLFISKKKRKEAETKFVEAMDKLEQTGFGAELTTGVVKTSFGITTFFNFLFYLITAVIASNPIMFALAGLIVILNTLGINEGLKAIKEKRFPKQRFAKMALPLKTAYIVGFIILVFI